jgi:hypothetical protein
MIVDWVEGETASRDFILKEDGIPFNLTGLAVTLELRDRDGGPIDTAGDISFPAQVGADVGKVVYAPDAADLMPGANEPYVTTKISDPVGSFAYFVRRARFKVIDAFGGVGYFPRGDPDLWRIHKVQG